MTRARIAGLGAFTLAVGWLAWGLIDMTLHDGWSNLSDPGEGLFLPLVVMAFSFTGLLLVFKVPENRMGWIYLLSGVLGGISIAFTGPAMAIDPSTPGWAYRAVIGQAFYFPWILATIALPVMLFPTGRPPSPRWRWAVRIITVAMVWGLLGFLTVSELELEHDSSGVLTVENPIDIGLLEPLTSPPLSIFAFGLLLISLLTPIVSMVVRYRGSQGVARLQLKWFLFVAAFAGVGLALTYTIGELDSPPFWLDAATFVGVVGLLAIPVATGLAIVRYRLYEIDRLISRTISYGLLIAILAGVYFGGVLAIGLVLPSDDPITVAGSTLLIVVLFNPIRRWVQERIDRRFYRTRYDGEIVLDQLTGRLRDQLDMAELADELKTAAESAVRPSSIGVWVRS